MVVSWRCYFIDISANRLCCSKVKCTIRISSNTSLFTCKNQPTIRYTPCQEGKNDDYNENSIYLNIAFLGRQLHLGFLCLVWVSFVLLGWDRTNGIPDVLPVQESDINTLLLLYITCWDLDIISW